LAEKWRDRGDGVLECINEKGEVIAVQKQRPKTPAQIVDGVVIQKGSNPGKGRRREEDKNSHHFVLDGRGRKLWVPKGTDPDSLPRLIYPFAQVTCDHVCEMISEGMTISEIGKIEGMPPIQILYKWQREYPEFAEQLVFAKKQRAERRADKLMAIADQKTISEARVPGERLKKDIYQWGAEMDDRATYGKQTKVVGDATQPVVFQVTTGVPDPVIDVASEAVRAIASEKSE